jgi:predicted nucleotidyltransferase
MKMLCKTLGGSRAYGLDTPESDTDYRGVFINTVPAVILGLSRYDVLQKQESDDIVYFEVRKFFELLKNGNTGAMEILFNKKEEFLELDPAFEMVYENRFKFVDTDKMFKCLRGYMQGELRLANGERTGQLGGKRKLQLEKYGFSPKNFVQLFRLAYAGVTLFQEGHFPVNVREEAPLFAEELFKLKTQPFNYTKEQLNADYVKAEAGLVEAYETRKHQFKFDEALANDVLRKLYLPYLK